MMLFVLFALVFLSGLASLTTYFFIKSPKFRKTILLTGLFASLILTVALAVYPDLPRRCYRKLKSTVNWTENRHEKSNKNTQAAVCNCRVQSGQLPKDPYAKHRSEAKQLSGDQFIPNAQVRTELMKEGDLVRIPHIMGLKIRPLTHSSKDLHKNALPRLQELISRFTATCEARGIKEGELILSSVTRTEDQQKLVRKKFKNAATPGKSAHSFGAAVDILGVSSKGSCSKTKKALYDVLKNMRSEGKILLCPESQCIHVTFRK